MRTPLLIVGLALLSIDGPAAAQPGGEEGKASKPRGGLTAFRSDAELRTYLRRLKRQQDAIPPAIVYPPQPAPMPAPPPPPPPGGAPAPSAVVVTGTAL